MFTDNSGNGSVPSKTVPVPIDSNSLSSCARRDMDKTSNVDKTAATSDNERTTSRKRPREETEGDMMQETKKKKSNTLQKIFLHLFIHVTN